MHYYTDVLKKYAVFEGRATRKEFWMFLLFNTIISLVLNVVDTMLNTRFVVGLGQQGILAGIYSLAILVPTLAVTTRRLHDTGKSGWLILIPAAPVVLLFVPSLLIVVLPLMLLASLTLLVFYATNSTPGANKYGPNPKGM